MAARTQQDILQEIVGGFMPSMNKQRKQQYEFLRSERLRTGQSAGGANPALGAFAEASGQAAAEAGVAATGMAQREAEFEKQRADWQKQFEQGQTNWEATFEQRNRDQAMANAMNVYQQTGALTPEMLEMFGLGDASRGGQRGVKTQLDILGINDGGAAPVNTLAGRAQRPTWQAGKAGRRQQTWLQSQFG